MKWLYTIIVIAIIICAHCPNYKILKRSLRELIFHSRKGYLQSNYVILSQFTEEYGELEGNSLESRLSTRSVGEGRGVGGGGVGERRIREEDNAIIYNVIDMPVRDFAGFPSK